jgi:hypothetical protein
MEDWCSELIDELGEGLARAIGLQKNQTAEQFEEIVGSVLSWIGTLDVAERFRLMGNQTFQGNANSDQWLSLQRERGHSFTEAIRKTLFDRFGAGTIDPERAEVAYSKLMAQLLPRQSSRATELVAFATTNYDASIEIALDRLDFAVNDGRSTGMISTPTLMPQGMIAESNPLAIPVLHLHGAVGWYRNKGRIEIHGAEMPYNATLGEPALLMPDPKKDPDREAGVSALWTEFREALRRATHVFVAGHSLHDSVLVTELRRAMDAGARVAVTFYMPDVTDSFRTADAVADSEAMASQIRSQLSDAFVIPAALGPDLGLDSVAVGQWRG